MNQDETRMFAPEPWTIVAVGDEFQRIEIQDANGDAICVMAFGPNRQLAANHAGLLMTASKTFWTLRDSLQIIASGQPAAPGARRAAAKLLADMERLIAESTPTRLTIVRPN
jgi:hypothetical protein